MKQMSGSELILESLLKEGVEYIFGYPGGSVLDLYDSIHQQEKIEHILVRHEQAATHMADGYTRATGKIGVVLVTSGPGATNAITGIATAYMDSVPMIVLSGQVRSNMIGYDAFQECDMIGISRPIVKHSFLVKKAEEIPTIIKKAFYIASTGRPGPVVIDLPKDMLDNTKNVKYIEPENINMRSYNPTIKGHVKQIKKATEKLLVSQRPVLYLGGGAITANCSQEILDFVERLNLPVVNTLMGLGAFPGTHKNCLGMLGMHGTVEANRAMHNSDLIFAVGVRFDDRTTNNIAKYCPDATVIHIDIDPSSISKIIKADIPIVGSADYVLKSMLKIIKTPKENHLEAWWKLIEAWRKEDCLSYVKDKNSIKPQQAIEALYKLTNGDAYVTSDVGQHQMFAALYYQFDKPRRWINSGGLGTMGFGLPAALGIKVALPDEEVVCVTGDGSIQMNIQELSTALQYNLPIKIINLNNRYLGMVKQWQDMIYQSRHSHSYMESVPNFVEISEAYGHKGVVIDNPNTLEEDLKKALAIKDKLVFIDIMVDKEEHVYPMLVYGESMNDMWLKKNKRTN